MTKTQNQEVEWKLAIIDENPADVLERVSTLTELAGLRLDPTQGRAIRDVYFDLPDRSLTAQRVALRYREQDGRGYYTMKRDAVTDASGRSSRQEVERPATPEGLGEVLQAIGDAGVTVPGAESDADGVEALTSRGFIVIQDRTNRREVRRLLDPTSSAELAEMVLDTVRYVVGGVAVHHREIEVELVDASGEAAVVKLVQALREREASLVPWTLNKLRTGAALASLVDADTEGIQAGDLTPTVYERLRSLY